MGVERPKTILQTAQDLEKSGNLKEASRKYASLISVLRRRGKYQEALMVCEKALSLSPQSSRLYLSKAVCLSDLKKQDEAIVEIGKMASSALRQNRVTQYLELIQDKLDAYPKLQVSFCEKVLEVERTRADIFLALSKILLREGQMEGSLEMAFAALKTGQDEALCYEQLKQAVVARGRTEDLQYLENLVKKNWSLGKTKQFILGNSIAEESKEKTDISQEHSLDGIGEVSIRKLIQELEEQLGERPKGVETSTGLLREFKEKAFKVVNDDWKAALDMAVAFKEMGLFSEAKEFILKVPQESDLYFQGQSLMGEIEFELGSYFLALDIFQSLLRESSSVLSEKEDMQNQERLNLVKKESLYYCVRIYFELGDFDRAQQFAAQLSELDHSYRNLGTLRAGIAQKLNQNAKL